MMVSSQQGRMIVVTGVILGGLYFLWIVRNALYPFLLALLLAYLLNPPVTYLEKKGLHRVWGIIIVYLFLFAIIVGGGIRLIPLLIRELESFGRELPDMAAQGELFFQYIQTQVQNTILPYSLRVALDEGYLAMQLEAQNVLSEAVGGIISLLGHFAGLLISPVLAFYLLYDWHAMNRRLLVLIPRRWRHRTILIVADVDKVMNGVIRGQILIACIVGVLVSSGLYFLEVRFSLLIGILAGILDIVPYFGAFIGAAPAVTLALLYSPWLAVKVALLFLVIHQLEGTIIGPKILGGKVGLHPLTVIFSLFVGGELAGILGMLLGVPVAAVMKVLLHHLSEVIT